MIPALGLEQAMMDRILSLGTMDEDREKVVDAALGDLEAEASKTDSEVEIVRHRLTTVQAEIQNLVEVLKRMGAGAISSVQEELAKLEAERRQLRDRLHAPPPKTNKEPRRRFFVNRRSNCLPIRSKGSKRPWLSMTGQLTAGFRKTFGDNAL